METPGRLEDSPNLTGRAGFIRAHSAASTMADRRGAFLRAEAPASVAADMRAVAGTAVVGIGNRAFARFLAGLKNLEMERSHMRRTKLNFDKFHWAGLSTLAAVAVLLAGCCFPTHSVAQQAGQKTFSSAAGGEPRSVFGSAE